MSVQKKYKVRLDSGRVLGPLDLERIRQLILKSRVLGKEKARAYPKGEWCPISQIPEIADLLIAHLEGRLATLSEEDREAAVNGPSVGTQTLAMLPTLSIQQTSGQPATRPLSGPEDVPVASKIEGIPALPAETSPGVLVAPTEAQKIEIETKFHQIVDAAKTRVRQDDEVEPTEVATIRPEELKKSEVTPTGIDFKFERAEAMELVESPRSRKISDEPTIVLARKADPMGGADAKRLPGKSRIEKKDLLRAVLIAGLLGYLGYDFLFEEPQKSAQEERPAPFRPTLPDSLNQVQDPQASAKLFVEAMRHYALDTIPGYKSAAAKLRNAAELDGGNVKALAMLAATYLHLIDVSNKDERYFKVITDLIDLSRSKAMDLPETVIADVEFYLTVNQPEVAQQRIVRYTQQVASFPPELYFYLAKSFFQRGDPRNSIKYIAGYPESKFFSPAVHYLRGQMAEAVGDLESAKGEYQKAIQKSATHARSRLRFAMILISQGKHSEGLKQLAYIVDHSQLLGPTDLAQAYAAVSLLLQSDPKRSDEALAYIERAVALEPRNHDYLFELYTQRARAGDRDPKAKSEARMYLALSEGEKLAKAGRYNDALIKFLEARGANGESALPLVKIGDMFMNKRDISKARMNYEMAAARAKRSVAVWSKYIESLIQSYDWDAALKAIQELQKIAPSQSIVDKANGDRLAKMGSHAEALGYYRRAMGAASIDSSVYVAYANSLLQTKAYKDASFFYALALRFDPLNLDAIIGNARAVAAKDSLERAIILLKDEVEKSSSPKAELLSAIAELQIQRGEWMLAQQFIDQARAIDPELPTPFKLQAQIHLNNEGRDKRAIEKALEAYKSYSDRNLSDPSGYLERYKMFIKSAKLQAANDELMRIFAIFPKYPNLYFYKGTLYGVMGDHAKAAEAFAVELKNNPNSPNVLIAYGRELIYLGKHTDALASFRRAIEQAPKAPEPKFWAGYANYMLKNYSAAIALYQSSLATDPGNPLIYKRLGEAYRDAGDVTQSKTAFRKYLEMEPDAQDRAEILRDTGSR